MAHSTCLLGPPRSSRPTCDHAGNACSEQQQRRRFGDWITADVLNSLSGDENSIFGLVRQVAADHLGDREAGAGVVHLPQSRVKAVLAGDNRIALQAGKRAGAGKLEVFG